MLRSVIPDTFQLSDDLSKLEKDTSEKIATLEEALVRGVVWEGRGLGGVGGEITCALAHTYIQLILTSHHPHHHTGC